MRPAQGVGALLASRLVMIACAYATFAIVARALATADFGVYGIILSIVNVVNAVLGTGTNQAMSLLVSRHPHAATSLYSAALWWSLLAAGVAALSLRAGAPLLAAGLGDDSLTPLLMISALGPGFYAITATSLGFLNGVRAFTAQGFVNVAQSVTRLVLVSAAAVLGYGVRGTCYALVIAGAVGAIIARRLAKLSTAGAGVALRSSEIAGTLGGFVGVALLLQLLLSADLLLIKRLVPGDSANQQAGVYTAAQSIARVPFFLLIGVSQSAYPRLSARGAGSALSAQRASTLVLSGLVVALAGLVALSVPLRDDLIRCIYPERYAEGGSVLGWLLCGSAALSLAEASLTMLSGVTDARRSALILAVCVLVQLGLGFLWIPRHGVAGGAQATLIAAALAAALAALWLRRLVGTTLSAHLVGSAVLPALTLWLASWLFGQLGLGSVSTVAFMAAAYSVYLLGIYRLNKAELNALLRA